MMVIVLKGQGCNCPFTLWSRLTLILYPGQRSPHLWCRSSCLRYSASLFVCSIFLYSSSSCLCCLPVNNDQKDKVAIVHLLCGPGQHLSRIQADALSICGTIPLVYTIQPAYLGFLSSCIPLPPVCAVSSVCADLSMSYNSLYRFPISPFTPHVRGDDWSRQTPEVKYISLVKALCIVFR